MSKLIAIAILGLLALSSVMKPQAFRMLLGMLAVAALALAASTGYLGDQASNQLQELRSLLQTQTGVEELSDATSDRIMSKLPSAGSEFDPAKDLVVDSDSGNPTTDPNPVAEPPKLQIRLKQNDKVTLQKIHTTMSQYLAQYRKENPHDEAARYLRPDLLNPNLLKFRVIQDDQGRYLVDQNKSFKVRVVFDPAFKNHVIQRGRQILPAVRLQKSFFYSSVCGAVLLLLFGILKFINSRRRQHPERDYLRLSDVSMV